jgi:putative membrane protein insertion efficiency factor
MRPMSPSRPNSERSSTVGTSLSDPDPSGPARVGLALIRAYKVLLSPWFTGSCRYVPGCADYTSEAVARFGLLRGSWLGARRLGRCHPLGGHGLDPVPHRHTSQ